MYRGLDKRWSAADQEPSQGQCGHWACNNETGNSRQVRAAVKSQAGALAAGTNRKTLNGWEFDQPVIAVSRTVHDLNHVSLLSRGDRFPERRVNRCARQCCGQWTIGISRPRNEPRCGANRSGRLIKAQRSYLVAERFHIINA